MKVIIGEKKEMTQIFDDTGKIVPCTIVDVSNVVICGLKTKDKDGYTAFVLGKGKEKKSNKSEIGKYKKVGYVPKHVFEFKIRKSEEHLEVGDKVTADMFENGDMVKVTGITKGKGFQGVVKRWGMAGWAKTHGNSDRQRAGGSIGSEGYGRVYKGKKMPGRMGGNQKSILNSKIIKIDIENNYICVKGSVPGGKNSVLLITKD